MISSQTQAHTLSKCVDTVTTEYTNTTKYCVATAFVNPVGGLECQTANSIVELYGYTACFLSGSPLNSNVIYFILSSDKGGAYLDWTAVFPSEFANIHPKFKIYATEYPLQPQPTQASQINSVANFQTVIDITSKLHIVNNNGNYKVYITTVTIPYVDMSCRFCPESNPLITIPHKSSTPREPTRCPALARPVDRATRCRSPDIIRACRHLSQASVQTKCRPARKLRAVFS